jgi:pyrophosphatase PpaX
MTPPQPLAAILFDLDGTLLDTDVYISGAFNAVLLDAGLGPLDVERYRAVIGQPLADCYRHLAPGLDPVRLCEQHRVWQTRHLDLVKPMSGASELLESLRARGLKVAVVTTRSQRSSTPSLERSGLLSLLDTVVSAEDVSRHKPDPEPLRVALARLGVSPARAAMVGDTSADVDAGRAAGVQVVVGVDFGSVGPAIADTNPDAVLSRLSDLIEVLGSRLPEANARA